MRFRTIISPLITLAVIGGLVFAGYTTRDRWLPQVFPGQTAERVEARHGPEEEHDHDHEDRVKLTPQAQANLKLVVAPLAPREYWRTLLIPGIVVDRPGESDRGVTSRLAGVVSEIKARPGDTVKAGDPLFTIQVVSEYVQSTQAELAKAARELQIATAERDRIAGLVKLGTMSEASLIPQESQVKRSKTQVEGLRRQLQVFGLTPEQIDMAEKGEFVTEVVVTAPPRPQPDQRPASGTATSSQPPSEFVYEVQDLKVRLGEQVQAGQILALLANHQQLFVEGRAFKSEAMALARAAELRVPVRAEFADEPPGTWPPQEPLTIHHLANEVDPASRTFAFYLPLDNQAVTFTRDGKTHLVWRYRPGQRVRLWVPVEKLGDDVFVLPAGAVVREGPEAYVFRQNGDLFERKPVRVLYEDRSVAVVANDGSVSPGAFVVRNQAAAINRALKAEAGGDGGHDHGHDH